MSANSVTPAKKAGRPKGFKCSAETRERMSAAKRNQSADTKAKISKALTGRKFSAETLKKMSDASKGRTRTFSPETRAKMSAARTRLNRARSKNGLTSNLVAPV